MHFQARKQRIWSLSEWMFNNFWEIPWSLRSILAFLLKVTPKLLDSEEVRDSQLHRWWWVHLGIRNTMYIVQILQAKIGVGNHSGTHKATELNLQRAKFLLQLSRSSNILSAGTLQILSLWVQRKQNSHKKRHRKERSVLCPLLSELCMHCTHYERIQTRPTHSYSYKLYIFGAFHSV